MKFLAKTIFLNSLFLATLPARAENYRCQIVSQSPLYYRDMVWNGEVPFAYGIEYGGGAGEFRVTAIGAPGHPDYLFEIYAGTRPVLAVSQAKDLKDYNLTWRSDTQLNNFVSVACRVGMRPE